ncbi:MAG: hypothetical protein JJU06_01030 [Ectothiorhodospiraceae bacterium]|nr:hypothetical protein [Ectothiorhodospiraceae bacterium]MCH8506694.1 hypothetical protein [Ectothiorhodospiraceae bacterium]
MKPLGPLILLSVLLSLVTGCDLEAGKASDAERLIRDAQRIVIESGGQPEAQERALAKLSEAISVDPDQASAYRLRAGIFLEMDRRERARDDMKRAYTVSGSATDLLPYCILDEQAYGWRREAQSCYQQVVTLLEESLATEAYQDLNYLVIPPDSNSSQK